MLSVEELKRNVSNKSLDNKAFQRIQNCSFWKKDVMGLCERLKRERNELSERKEKESEKM